MSTFLVLLRGVNVGKAKRVPMGDFKALLLDVGCTSAATLLNSGNAVVRAVRQSPAALATKISAALAARFGFSVPVVVVSADEFNKILAECPFAHQAQDASRLLVAFTQDPATLGQLRPIGALVSDTERWAIGGAAAYLLCTTGLLESKAGAALLGRVGYAVTTRNWGTVLKLQALAETSAALPL